MSKDVKRRLEQARQAVASWLPTDQSRSGRKRISGPQLIKRTLHVSYDSLSDTYQGVPDKWLPEFRSRLIEQVSTKKSGMSFASLPASSALSLAATPEEVTTAADRRDELNGADSPPPSPPPRQGQQGPRSHGAPSAVRWNSQSHVEPQVWYDRCSRRFVNIPPHWRERLQRNNLTEWAEFQRNPALLTNVFTMMDEELRKMNLSELGLDSSVHSSETASSSQEGRANSIHAYSTTDEAAAPTAESATATVSGGGATASAASAVVWHQQRSFVRDDDSDSEEFTEL